MSSWPEAKYIVSKVTAAIEEYKKTWDVTDFNVIADAVEDGGKYFPSGHAGEEFVDEALWLVTEE